MDDDAMPSDDIGLEPVDLPEDADEEMLVDLQANDDDDASDDREAVDDSDDHEAADVDSDDHEAADDDSDDSDVVDVDELDGRLEAEALSEDVLTPGEDALAEPYHAVMVVDDEGHTTGQVWTFGGKMMLFATEEVANKVLAALEGGEIHWALRGVSQRHLEALELISDGQGVELFVVRGLTADGKVEAVPMRQDLALRRGPKPPPLPGGGS